MFPSSIAAACYMLLLTPHSTSPAPVSTIYGYTDINQAKQARNQIRSGMDAADQIDYDESDRKYKASPQYAIDQAAAVAKEKRLTEKCGQDFNCRMQQNTSSVSILYDGMPIRVSVWQSVQIVNAPNSTCKVETK